MKTLIFSLALISQSAMAALTCQGQSNTSLSSTYTVTVSLQTETTLLVKSTTHETRTGPRTYENDDAFNMVKLDAKKWKLTNKDSSENPQELILALTKIPLPRIPCERMGYHWGCSTTKIELVLPDGSKFFECKTGIQ